MRHVFFAPSNPHGHTAWALAVASWALCGCVGGIDRPEQYGDGTYCPPEVRVEELFLERCGGSICHGSGSTTAGGLDLESPGLVDRMIGVPAVECDGRVRISATNPAESFLIDKLIGPPVGCGERMPPVGHLSDNEVTCIRRWVTAAVEAHTSGGGDGAIEDVEGVDAGSVGEGGVP